MRRGVFGILGMGVRFNFLKDKKALSQLNGYRKAGLMVAKGATA